MKFVLFLVGAGTLALLAAVLPWASVGEVMDGLSGRMVALVGGLALLALIAVLVGVLLLVAYVRIRISRPPGQSAPDQSAPDQSAPVHER
ncbi:hypothetical protein HII36_36020 [Nonomuraea sp. NN258]|uniref:hypothetical protein n=1 Tax=Nonomuraea antri TaxID=2730852 RepID=UPI0015692285|nr:hypothetical protein [Nonomuraea antri]NRQ37206.1 hypothetical protein [Nonomuraea antri]